MGLFDLPAPLLSQIDHGLSLVLPPFVRLLLWGILAGWLTMVVYRRLSNQERIEELKLEQKSQQSRIADFDGDFSELFPLIRQTLGLGMRQLGLSLGPALLATLPVLFLIAWVAGQFGYQQPPPGSTVAVTASGLDDNAPPLAWDSTAAVESVESGWIVSWPQQEARLSLLEGNVPLLTLPLDHSVPVIHKKLWWNLLFGNPLGYLPDQAGVEAISIELPAQQFVPVGPDWMRGWMFLFFSVFLLSSVAFKLVLRIS